MRAAAAAGAFALLVSFACPALAQPPTEKARAEGLFNEGRASIARGNYVDACPKFEESQRLDPAVGTLINLAECHEHEKRLVAAWSAYRDAAALAAKRKDARRQKYAEDHAATLDAKLSRLAVVVTGDRR